MDKEVEKIFNNFNFDATIHKDVYGKNYILVTKGMKEKLPPTTKIYHVTTLEGDTVDAIAPFNCEHDYKISKGMPSNIRGCKKCIEWEFINS